MCRGPAAASRLSSPLHSLSVSAPSTLSAAGPGRLGHVLSVRPANGRVTKPGTTSAYSKGRPLPDMASPPCRPVPPPIRPTRLRLPGSRATLYGGRKRGPAVDGGWDPLRWPMADGRRGHGRGGEEDSLRAAEGGVPIACARWTRIRGHAASKLLHVYLYVSQGRRHAAVTVRCARV